jgi:hypothetical protein
MKLRRVTGPGGPPALTTRVTRRRLYRVLNPGGLRLEGLRYSCQTARSFLIEAQIAALT